MSQYDSVLKIYAESGLRTVENWIALGREIASGAKPRSDTPYRGALLPLYSRDQTHARARSRRQRP
jgi:hypothetical protein